MRYKYLLFMALILSAVACNPEPPPPRCEQDGERCITHEVTGFPIMLGDKEQIIIAIDKDGPRVHVGRLQFLLRDGAQLESVDLYRDQVRLESTLKGGASAYELYVDFWLEPGENFLYIIASGKGYMDLKLLFTSPVRTSLTASVSY